MSFMLQCEIFCDFFFHFREMDNETERIEVAIFEYVNYNKYDKKMYHIHCESGLSFEEEN